MIKFYRWLIGFHPRRKAILVGAVVVGALLTVIARYYIFFVDSEIACYRIKENCLPDISDASPRKGKSIFFHETSCTSYLNGKIQISSRQACAVESAARLNPNFDVYLLYTSPGIIKYEGAESDQFLKALLTYKNIKIHHLDYGKYTEGTPVETLYSGGTVERSHYPLIHASDIVRFLTLWKYGGIYLDLDVVVIKSLEDLHPNYAGLESGSSVNNAIINLTPTGKGHEWAQSILEDLRDDFRGNSWGYNGPGVLTRFIVKLCNTDNPKGPFPINCQGFTLYPPQVFYAVAFWKWKIFFDDRYNDKLENAVRNSNIIHVWNNQSKNTTIHITSDVPYSRYAKKFCPKVFAECKEFF